MIDGYYHSTSLDVEADIANIKIKNTPGLETIIDDEKLIDSKSFCDYLFEVSVEKS